MAFECPRRSSPPSPMFDADTGCIATDPAPSARRRFRSKTGIENLPANEHAQETPHTPSPTRTTRRIQSGCAGSRPRLRDGMPGSPSQHIDITRAKWIPYSGKIQGIFTKIGEFGPMTGGNPLKTGGFPVNSLQNITGKFKTRTGTSMRGTGNLKLRTVSDGVDACLSQKLKPGADNADLVALRGRRRADSMAG